MGWGPHGPSVYAARRIGPRRHLNDRGLYAAATRSAALQHEDVHAGLLEPVGGGGDTRSDDDDTLAGHVLDSLRLRDG